MKYEIGDYVKVINPGCGYINYRIMAKFFGMKNWEYDRSLRKEDPQSIYKIINIHKHLSYDGSIVVYIRNIDNNREYMIDEDGLEFYEEFIKEEEFSI